MSRESRRLERKTRRRERSEEINGSSKNNRIRREPSHRVKAWIRAGEERHTHQVGNNL